MFKKTKYIFLLVLICVCITNAYAFSFKEGTFTVTYKGRTHTLKYIYPNKNKRFPAILLINGFSPQEIARYGFLVVYGDIQDEHIADKIIDKVKILNPCTGKVGVIGHSFGGALAMVIASYTKKIDAVVEMGGLLHPANNIDLSKDMPSPILFISGEKDPLVKPYQTKAMYEKLKAGGKDAEIYIVPNQGHGFGGIQRQKVLIKAVKFFKKHLY